MNVNEAFPRRSGGNGTPDIPIRDIVDRLTENTETLCRELLPNGRREGAEWRCGSVNGEVGKSLGVHLTGAKAGVWADFADGSGGDPLDLIQACLGLDKGGAVSWGKVDRIRVRGGGLEPQEEVEIAREINNSCCAVLRHSAPFGPQGPTWAFSVTRE